MRYTEILEACWSGYRQQGMKKKGDRVVPNCVPVSEQEMEEDLRKWFKEKWVRFGPDGKIRGDCARGSSKEGKPKCLPQSKAHALGKKGRASAAAKKRREDPNPERRGPAKNVATRVKENSNPKFAALIKNIQARMKKDDYQRPELIKRVAQMVQQADPTVQDAISTARELVQQYGQGPAVKQTNVWDLKAQARSGNLAAQLPKTSAGTPSYAQQHATFEEQSTNNDDWYDDADEFGMPGSEFFPDEDDRLRDGDYVRDRQDGEHGEIFRMSGDPTERRVRILDRDGQGWYISPERLVAVDRNDPDIMRYFGKRRQRDMDEGTVSDALQNYLKVTGENDVEAVKTAIQKIARDASLKPNAKARLLGQVGMMIKTHKLPVGREYYQYMQQFMEDELQEKQDACYRKVKSRYKVWPSAYASGALVQCRKKGAANWGNKTKKE